MTIRALVFDFDGLILETEEPILRSWQEIFQAHGFELPFEKWALNIGTMDEQFNPFDELEARLGRKVDRRQIEGQRREREMELVLSQPPMPGVVETLRQAKRLGLKVGLASSSSCEWVEGHLSRLGLLDDFDCVVGGDDVQRTKPDPSLYLGALECLGVAPEQAIAFEDSPNGILAAKRAGMFCVAVPTHITGSLPTDHADLRLDSLAAMPLEALIARIQPDAESNE
jgi:HAD superfamily hydrolase (TIGR01509 family)